MKRGTQILKERIRNFNYTVMQLNICSKEQGSCDNCSDKEECVHEYDERCGIWNMKISPVGLIRAMAVLKNSQ